MSRLDEIVAALPPQEREIALAQIAAAEAKMAAELAEIRRPLTREEIAASNRIKAKIRREKAFSGTPRSL
jgi:hypothetical protein